MAPQRQWPWRSVVGVSVIGLSPVTTGAGGGYQNRVVFAWGNIRVVVETWS